jgi:hypothetical protein
MLRCCSHSTWMTCFLLPRVDNESCSDPSQPFLRPSSFASFGYASKCVLWCFLVLVCVCVCVCVCLSANVWCLCACVCLCENVCENVCVDEYVCLYMSVCVLVSWRTDRSQVHLAWTPRRQNAAAQSRLLLSMTSKPIPHSCASIASIWCSSASSPRCFDYSFA